MSDACRCKSLLQVTLRFSASANIRESENAKKIKLLRGSIGCNTWNQNHEAICSIVILEQHLIFICLPSACNLTTPLDSISEPLLDGLVRCHFVLLGQVDL
jgi:hypothetical protein